MGTSVAKELFGREEELAHLRLFLESIRRDGGVRMVRGEPGVGKSALLDAAADLAVAEGVRVLRANGAEFEADVSYSLLNQLLLPLFTDVQRLPPALRDALIVALGFGPGPAPAALLVCNATLLLLTTAARTKPTLLVVDDVQWIDRPSAVVLGFVARRVPGTPVGVIAASRTGTESFLDRHGLAEVTVEPLSDEAAARLVDARFPAMIGRRRQRLLELAQGNPLALVELPDSLTDSAQPTDVVPLSDRLQAIFATRLADLAEPTRLMLLLATFEGSGDLRTLRGMTDLAHLAPAERAQLVRVDDADGRIVFRHPLIQSAIVAMSTHEERRLAHQAIAAALPGDPERRAWHLVAATAGPDEAVALQLEEAAHVVLRRGDALAAVAALVRAAEMSGTPEDTARRLAQAAYTGVEAGVAGDATTLLADARGMSQDPAGALLAANAAALLMINGDGDVPTAHRLLAGAIEVGAHGWHADNPALDEAMHTLLLLSWFAGSADHWAVFHRNLARLTPAPPDILSVMSRTFPDPVRTGAAAQPDLEALIAALPDEKDLTRIVRTGTAAAQLNRLGEIREHSWRLVRQGREGGAPQWQLSGLMHLCEDDYLTGRWDEVEELAGEGERVAAASGLPFLRWYFLLNQAVIAAGRGRFSEAYDLADEITRWATPRGVASWLSIANLPRTLAAMAEGDFEAAYRYATAISPAGVLAPYVPIATWVMADLVEAALRTGRTAEARAHAEAMRAADVAALSTRMRLVQHGVDALVLGDEAGDRLEQTLTDSASERWLFESSRIRLAFAEKLRRGKELDRARTHLLAARTGFAAMGAEPWLARTIGELRATGDRSAVTEQPPPALTAQELEIAGLAAAGLTNKQIAERLHLSHRTVGAHLYRVFPKLGVSSRAGLRDALNEA
ncbi:DNA-binding NarL/FixJ family response regulator [Actinoplanes lutulentus]|uniref:Regulatory LuxR family protein n=1 Tax=Actinoplanes lutulentus TaxID=1287878 RepID=A0A327YX36_9ACTN|nr:LuxR family transcriptional regulator [Actinoplanes lutulentus]MBB2946446.1 DNA-binding NarL/FixJ family response regulator [Actinoplanes lutulentus]RAK25422.1 regulatory LuxR family protein [Actinoplanes lutulentus]